MGDDRQGARRSTTSTRCSGLRRCGSRRRDDGGRARRDERQACRPTSRRQRSRSATSSASGSRAGCPVRRTSGSRRVDAGVGAEVVRTIRSHASHSRAWCAPRRWAAGIGCRAPPIVLGHSSGGMKSFYALGPNARSARRCDSAPEHAEQRVEVVIERRAVALRARQRAVVAPRAVLVHELLPKLSYVSVPDPDRTHGSRRRRVAAARSEREARTASSGLHQKLSAVETTPLTVNGSPASPPQLARRLDAARRHADAQRADDRGCRRAPIGMPPDARTPRDVRLPIA